MTGNLQKTDKPENTFGPESSILPELSEIRPVTEIVKYDQCSLNKRTINPQYSN